MLLGVVGTVLLVTLLLAQLFTFQRLGLLFEPLGRIAAALTLPFAVYTVRAAELFASLPENALPVGKVSLGWVLLFYGLLFGLTCFGGRIKSWLAGRTGHKPGSH